MMTDSLCNLTLSPTELITAIFIVIRAENMYSLEVFVEIGYNAIKSVGT